MANEILCDRCGREFFEDEIQQCDCGVPFCDQCLDYHVPGCNDANKVGCASAGCCDDEEPDDAR